MARFRYKVQVQIQVSADPVTSSTPSTPVSAMKLGIFQIASATVAVISEAKDLIRVVEEDFVPAVEDLVRVVEEELVTLEVVEDLVQILVEGLVRVVEEEVVTREVAVLAED